MGGAQGFQLRELDSHIFHGSGAALAGVPRAAHFHSARLIAEPGSPRNGRRPPWPASVRWRAAGQSQADGHRAR